MEKRIKVCPVPACFPKKFFFLIKNKRIYNSFHDLKDRLIENGISVNDIDYWVNTLHVCNTFFGWNPLFIQVGRGYNKEINKFQNSSRWVEYYYCNDVLVHDIDKTINYHQPYLNVDTLEEQLLSLNGNLFV